MNFTNKLRVLFLAIILIGCVFSATAQQSTEPQYKIVGNEIVKVKTKSKTGAKKTELIHKVKDSAYNVWQSPKGAYYIWRMSKKTKKAYKQYLKIK